jgi:prepilin-type N-terminal cleavage/methylation domain-containing protein
MTWATGRARRRAGGGFTLVELVLVLVILALLAAAVVPSVMGVRAGHMAREPLDLLRQTARECRARAMEEGRPYVIHFHSEGYVAGRFMGLVRTDTELDQLRERQALDPRNSGGAMVAAYAELEAMGRGELPGVGAGESAAGIAGGWGKEFTLGSGMVLEVGFWGEGEPKEVPRGVVRSWVFQPSGLCEPLRVRIGLRGETYPLQFSALTADKEVGGGR